MSVKPSAKVVPISRNVASAKSSPATNARRGKRGHEIAQSNAISRLNERVGHLEALVLAALEQRMARSGIKRPFQIALASSILFHVLAIGLVTFKGPDKNTAKNDQTLEVVLVNAQSKAKPLKPQVLAQSNLAGGGNTDADRRAKSPVPLLRTDPNFNDVAEARRRVVQLEQEARQMMTRAKSNHTATAVPLQPVPQVEPQPPAPLSNSQSEVERRLAIQRLEAEVAKQWETYQKRPRRQTVGASASEYRFARYVEDWRVKVEKTGEAHYPQAARDKKIYGSLLLIVSIKSNGAIDGIEIRRSSGSKILDDAAKNIVRMGAPYAPFPPDVARDTDIIDISRTWRFTSSDRLETE